MHLPPPEWTPTATEYHATDAVSGTRVKLFMQKPHTYRGIYHDRSEAEPRKRSTALRRGTAYSALLQDDESSISVSTAGPNSKAFKTAEFAAAKNGRTLVTKDEMDTARMMIHVLKTRDTRAAQLARSLMFEGQGFFEYAFRFQHWSGIPCKAMMDRLRVRGRGLCVVENKSSRDPSPEGMSRQGEELGYDVQCGHNLAAIESHFGVVPEYWYICQRPEPDWEICVMEADQSYYDAKEEVDATLVRMANSIETGVWGQPYELLDDDEVPKLKRPRYRKSWRQAWSD